MKFVFKVNAVAFTVVAVLLTGSVGYGQTHTEGQTLEQERHEGLAAMQMAANETCKQGGDGCAKAQEDVTEASRQTVKNIVLGESAGEGVNLRSGANRTCPFCK